MGAVAAELRVDGFEPPHKIAHLVPRVWPACGSAKMRPAAKRPRFIDDATAHQIEQRAPSRRGIAGIRHAAPPACPEGRGHDQRLARREHRRPACKFELAALRPAHAITGHGPMIDLGIDRARGLKRFLQWFVDGFLHARTGAVPPLGCKAAQRVFSSPYFFAGAPILIVNSEDPAFCSTRFTPTSGRFIGTWICWPS